MQEGNFSDNKNPIKFVEEEWDKKKILITSVLLGALIVGGIGAKVFVLGENKQKTSPKQNVKEVEGVSTTLNKNNNPTPSVPFPQKVRNEVQSQVENIRQEILNLDPVQVASSSPQVQKILRDLGALEQYPKSQAKEVCENICKQIQ